MVHARHVDDAALVAGVNDRVQLSEIGKELNRRVVAAHQRDGVTVIDPATTWIDVDVAVGRDTVIAPGSQLLGDTRVGTGCRIGPDTTLADVRVGDGASVVRTHASAAVIGDGADVGPFTYLRPGTRLGAGGKLGAFVETKNSVIGAGTKVPHLTYVGDADIGEHSNIGAPGDGALSYMGFLAAMNGGVVTVGGILKTGTGGTINIGTGGTTGVLLGGTGSFTNNGTSC